MVKAVIFMEGGIAMSLRKGWSLTDINHSRRCVMAEPVKIGLSMLALGKPEPFRSAQVKLLFLTGLLLSLHAFGLFALLFGLIIPFSFGLKVIIESYYNIMTFIF